MHFPLLFFLFLIFPLSHLLARALTRSRAYLFRFPVLCIPFPPCFAFFLSLKGTLFSFSISISFFFSLTLVLAHSISPIALSPSSFFSSLFSPFHILFLPPLSLVLAHSISPTSPLSLSSKSRKTRARKIRMTFYLLPPYFIISSSARPQKPLPTQAEGHFLHHL